MKNSQRIALVIVAAGLLSWIVLWFSSIGGPFLRIAVSALSCVTAGVSWFLARAFARRDETLDFNTPATSLARASRARSHLLVNLEHDIRSPIDHILELAELAMLEDLTNAQRLHLGQIHTSAESLRELLNNVLDSAAAEVNRLNLRPVPFQFRETFSQLLRAYSHELRTDQKSLTHFVQSRVPENLRGDVERLESVLHNLVHYVCDVAPHESIVLRVSVNDRQEHAVELLFSLTSPEGFVAGSTIDHLLSDVQEGYVRSENLSAADFGLRVSVQLISSLGGELWVKRTPSRPDEICFTSRFEIAGPSSKDASLKQTQLGLIPDLPVLLVHASNEQRQEIEDILFRWQTEPSCVASVQEMWEALENERSSGVPFELIIIDAHLGKIDGFELCAELKSNQYHTAIPVIILTDVDHPGEGIKASRAGASTHVVRPFRSSTLARAIMSAVLGKGRYRQLRKDLGAAEMYVRSLIPPPIKEPISVDWRYVPAADLAGDSFGFHWIDDDSCAFYLIDVTGHGMDASLLSVSVLNVLKSMALPDTDFHDPDQVLSRLNEKFPMATHGDRCFTAWYGVYLRSRNELVWSGGGHPPSVLVHQDGDQRESVLLESSGPLMGMLPSSDFPAFSRQVVPGDKLYIFSDGVFEIELANGQYAEFHDFVSFLRDYSEEERSTLDELWERARTLHGQDVLDDDFTILEVCL